MRGKREVVKNGWWFLRLRLVKWFGLLCRL